MRQALLLGLLLCTVGTGATPPVEHFTRFADYEQARISPTGKYLAVTTRAEDRERLLVIEIETNKVLYGTDFGRNWSVADFLWATPERILVQPARRIPGVTDSHYRTRAIYGLNADGSEARVLFGEGGRVRRLSDGGPTTGSVEILHLLPDEPRQVLIGTSPPSTGKRPGHAQRLDIHTGELEVVAAGRYFSSRFVADRSGNVRFDIGSTDDNVTEVRYLEGDGSAELVASGRVQDGVIWPIAEADDGWFAFDNRETETTRLVHWQPETGKVEVLFHDPDVDIEAALHDADRRLVGVRYSPHYPDFFYLDPDSPLALAHRRIRATFPNEDLRLTSLTDDASRAVAVVSGDRYPATFYLVDLAGPRLTELFQARPWLATDDLNPMEPFEVKARDGTSVRGYLTTPAGSSEGEPLPLIVLVHGGPHGVRDHWGFNPEAQLFASRGFAVLQVNFRGSGGYGKTFLHSGYGRWGREMQDDVTDATRWAVSARIADPERICIYGASYGGYAALTGTFREPDLYRCTVGYVGVYDLDMMLRKGDIPSFRAGRSYLKEAVGDDREELRARSPAHNADRIKAAVMLVHGGRDQRVPIAQARALHSALRKAGNPVEVWHVKPMEGHGFGDPGNRLEMYTEMLAFFDRHIGRGVDLAE